MIEQLITDQLNQSLAHNARLKTDKNETWYGYYYVFGVKTSETYTIVNTNSFAHDQQTITREKLAPWDLGMRVWWHDDITQTNHA